MEISEERSSVRRLAVLKRMRGPHTRCHATGGPAAGGRPRDFWINDSNIGDTYLLPSLDPESTVL